LTCFWQAAEDRSPGKIGTLRSNRRGADAGSVPCDVGRGCCAKCRGT
jgi:hypothetical protein